MKKFLVHFLGILALVLALLIVCDIAYTKIYYKSVARNKSQYVLGLKGEEFDAVFVGSSRVENHIDPQLFNKLSNKRSFNMGVCGAGLNDNFLLLKLLLRHSRAKNVFLQIDFNIEYTDPSHISLAESMPFIGDPIVKEHAKKYVPNFNALYYVPFYRYAINEPKLGFREMFFCLLDKKPKIHPGLEYAPRHGRLSLKKTEDIMADDAIINENPIFNEIKALCKRNNTKLIVFITPLCSNIKAGPYIEKMKKIAPDLLDLSQGYDDSLFNDCEHLTYEGSQILTKQLYEATKKECGFE